MLTNHDAIVLSQMLSESNMFPEARQEITRTLLDYYKELLANNQFSQIPTPRRMW
ncbi:MAG TPA: hypothetical protein VJ654_14155 [Noviherbaspirillum sp.]|nr:hypothetical protein [Noviherbaspirillum sp.]